jgi:hypothetical protein
MGVRFPLEPLIRAAEIAMIHDGEEGGQQPGQPYVGLAALAAQLGITHRMAQRLLAEGLSERQADHYACAIGRNPVNVWPEFELTAPGEEDLLEKRCRCHAADRRPVVTQDEGAPVAWCDRCGRRLQIPVEREITDAA